MTMTTPRLNIDPDFMPDEMMLVSTRSREVPSWLVQRYKPCVTTVCDICAELIYSREYAVYERGCSHPAHPACWLVQLTARPVRIISVSYR